MRYNMANRNCKKHVTKQQKQQSNCNVPSFHSFKTLRERAKAETETERGAPCGTLINGQMVRPLSQLFLSVCVCVCELQGSSVDVLNLLTQTRSICQPLLHAHTHTCWFLSTETKTKGKSKEFGHFTITLVNDCACVCVGVCMCVCPLNLQRVRVLLECCVPP